MENRFHKLSQLSTESLIEKIIQLEDELAHKERVNLEMNKLNEIQSKIIGRFNQRGWINE